MMAHLRPALYVQLTYLSFSLIWNLTGAGLIAAGHAALGPSASIWVALVIALLGVALVIGVNRIPWLYVAVTSITVLGAVIALKDTFTKDATLWPSEFWRLAGAAINAVALIGAAWAILLWRKKQDRTQ